MSNSSTPEFDRYDQSYKSVVENAMDFSGMSHDYVTRVKADLIVEAAKKRFGSLENREVLDVGCGVGLTDAFLQGQPWRLSGSDISSKSIAQAKQRNPGVNYAVGGEERLPFDDQSFDVCFTICVMHHVPPANWTSFLCEMRRVLRPNGIAMVLEHNPINPLTRLVVSRIPFDDDAVLLSARTLRKHLVAANLKPLSSRYILFTPWERLRTVDRVLGWLPVGAQYAFIAERADAARLTSDDSISERRRDCIIR
jgi:ubiquinone/menaquinone biosynthesis C-methylase UbiE